MLAEGKGPVNFQVFLGMFGDKISGKGDVKKIFLCLNVEIHRMG